jgi:hypothetical protein
MNLKNDQRKNHCLLVICLLCLFEARAQTDIDGLMMIKHNFCTGLMYQHSSWSNYWEGTLKRKNANLGHVSTDMVGVMANYGITSRLNALVGLPYVHKEASGGQLHPMKGLQDLSLWLKWMPLQKQLGKGQISVFAIGGYSLPVNKYPADFQPMSLGMGSKNLSLRGMVDYQFGKWFATASATYVRRSNVTIDRQAYFTTEMHYTNEVYMPNATQYNLRAGFRNGHWIIEAVGDNWTTHGGFDITRNNMPFPSNRMNMTSIGLHLKYDTKWLKGLSILAGGDQTVTGRNVGQATGGYVGVFYAFHIGKN